MSDIIKSEKAELATLVGREVKFTLTTGDSVMGKFEGHDENSIILSAPNGAIYRISKAHIIFTIIQPTRATVIPITKRR